MIHAKLQAGDRLNTRAAERVGLWSHVTPAGQGESPGQSPATSRHRARMLRLWASRGHVSRQRRALPGSRLQGRGAELERRYSRVAENHFMKSCSFLGALLFRLLPGTSSRSRGTVKGLPGAGCREGNELQSQWVEKGRKQQGILPLSAAAAASTGSRETPGWLGEC